MQQKLEPQALMQLKDPYEALRTKDALVENLDALNQLNPREIRELVTKMVLTCPEDEWEEFGTQIYLDLSAQSTAESEDSKEQDEMSQDFILSLNAAYSVKNCMKSLLNPKLSPYAVLQAIQMMDSEFDWEESYDGFNEYKPLVIILLANQGASLAQRLADATPKSERSKIARIIELMFVHTIFPQQVRAAFELKSTQEAELGENSTNESDSKATDESASESTDVTDSYDALESESDSEQDKGIEVDGIYYKNVRVYPNTLFAQSELRQRKQSTENYEPLPTKLSGSLLEELHEDEKNCCEKYCTLF